jgi:hypothetical protein
MMTVETGRAAIVVAGRCRQELRSVRETAAIVTTIAAAWIPGIDCAAAVLSARCVPLRYRQTDAKARSDASASR